MDIVSERVYGINMARALAEMPLHGYVQRALAAHSMHRPIAEWCRGVICRPCHAQQRTVCTPSHADGSGRLSARSCEDGGSFQRICQPREYDLADRQTSDVYDENAPIYIYIYI
jgi:hypothetical protein